MTPLMKIVSIKYEGAGWLAGRGTATWMLDAASEILFMKNDWSGE